LIRVLLFILNFFGCNEKRSNLACSCCNTLSYVISESLSFILCVFCGLLDSSHYSIVLSILVIFEVILDLIGSLNGLLWDLILSLNFFLLCQLLLLLFKHLSLHQSRSSKDLLPLGFLLQSFLFNSVQIILLMFIFCIVLYIYFHFWVFVLRFNVLHCFVVIQLLLDRLWFCLWGIGFYLGIFGNFTFTSVVFKIFGVVLWRFLLVQSW